jgi:retinol dehydrogenase-14
VREFARRFVDDHDRLDVLINNAGVMPGKRIETEDGFEWTFAVNYLGPFLLTNLLTGLLVSSAPSRIINVSSESYRTAKQGLKLDDLQMTEGFSPSKAYAASKMAIILFTGELERRLGSSGVTADALHPGVVATSFGKSEESSKMMGWMMTGLKPFLRKPARGARTSVFLATADPETLQAGLYWSDEKPKDPIAPAGDPDTAMQLWLESARLVGLSS